MAAEAGARRLRGQRLPGYVNVAAAAILLTLVAMIALRASSTQPPAVAEFAPQAQQIHQAPTEQTSSVGNGEGGAALPASPAPSPAASLAQGAILEDCVGDPPRQIEDPQSPPCVPFWQGNNGGATSSGVTSNTIWMGIPSDCGTANNPNGALPVYMDLNNFLPQFFNRRFEFYGRKVETWCMQGGPGQATAPAQRADADQMAAHRPAVFASMMYRSQSGQYYSQQTACVHKIVTATIEFFPRSTSYTHQCPGYLYQYPMDFDTESANLGQWACARLSGGNAVHAGGTDSEVPPKPLTSVERKFAIIYQPTYQDEAPGWQPLRTELQTCGAGVSDHDVLVNPVQDPNETGFPLNPGQANSAIVQLKQDNVTSIFCLCNFWTFGQFTKAADNQDYQPEWLVDTYGELDSAGTLQEISQASPSQLQHLFGITFRPRAIPVAEEPCYVAMREVDPTFNLDPEPNSVEACQQIYRDLLVLMSGFQMAGPHLTPETLGDGLERAVFPNPDTPLMAGKVGFAGFTYSMTIDAAEFWFGVGQQGPYPQGPNGSICYVEDGTRRGFGKWPRGGDPFFKPPCDGVT